MIGKHYYTFSKKTTNKIGRELNKDNWDLIREIEEGFCIPVDKMTYVSMCEGKSFYIKIADQIVELLKNDETLGSLLSLGCGCGIIEYHLKHKLSDIRMCCSDYTENSLRVLKSFDIFDEVFQFDILKGNYKYLSEYDYILLFRCSTEFNFDEWKNIFFKMYEAGIKKILFIPTEYATYNNIINEKNAHFNNIKNGIQDTFCGWLYSEDEFYKMFDELYFVRKNIKYEYTGVLLLERIC